MAQQSDKNKKLPLRFGPDLRLKKKAQFNRVFLGGFRAADQHLVVFARANQLRYSRLGVSVGKRLGSAVRRNRYKRTLREAFRLCRHELPAGFDYVLIPKRRGTSATRLYRQSLLRLSRKAVQRCKKEKTIDEGGK